MRKHDVRKWLHAVLDLLPVILIPVFMIYSHRHTLTERTEVEINYKYQSNEVNTIDDLVEGNIYFIDSLWLAEDSFPTLQDHNILFNILLYDEIEINFSQYNNGFNIDELVYDSQYSNDTNNGLLIDFTRYDDQITRFTLYFTNNDTYSAIHLDDDYASINFYNCVFQVVEGYINEYKVCYPLLDSLPQYTDYNVIESVSVEDSNNDIMSVFMDDFNNAIDKYFNMGNVFNLGGVYQWFNTNIFSGNAPTVIYSIWNIALYELVMDLLFLLYGLFMWFIDMIQKLMEKPLNSVK